MEKIKIKNLLKCKECGKPFKKITEYDYLPVCEHYPHRIISVGKRPSIRRKENKDYSCL